VDRLATLEKGLGGASILLHVDDLLDLHDRLHNVGRSLRYSSQITFPVFLHHTFEFHVAETLLRDLQPLRHVCDVIITPPHDLAELLFRRVWLLDIQQRTSSSFRCSRLGGPLRSTI